MNYSPRIQYHIHVNYFGNILPPSLDHLIAIKSFRATECIIKDETGNEDPLWIVTKKVNTKLKALNTFNYAVSKMSSDEMMEGYIECEFIIDGAIIYFEDRPFSGNLDLPISLTTFIGDQRGADIHLFRRNSIPYDNLDVHLQSLGFYEVVRKEDRIWTYLLADPDNAESIYQKLKSFFSINGGVYKIEKELVESIRPIPDNFKMKDVALSF